VTTLVIPHHNDSEEELTKIAQFIVAIDPGIPWHVTQFYPTYKLTNEPRTPIETLQKARDIGEKAGLRYVYTGNIPGDEGENTYCYKCGKLLIQRMGYLIQANHIIDDSLCPSCGAEIDGIELT